MATKKKAAAKKVVSKKSVTNKPVTKKTAKTTGTKKPVTKSRPTTTEKLKTVTPSGKRDASFFELVFDVVAEIPKGRVTSYGAIAKCLGTKLSSRTVGWAMHAAHGYPKVPAHRVVNRNGMLTGKHHFGTPTRMEELLAKEGVVVKDDKIVDFQRHFWDPATEL